ncbi:hypothetical protein ACHAPZ_010216 [Fusarium culmorum]
MNGQIGVVCLLAEYCADLEAEDSDGYRALHYAVGNDNDLLLRCLLKLGVDMEQRLPNGITVLEYAYVEGKMDIVSSLLEFGASAMTKGKDMYIVPQRPPIEQLIACAKHGNMTQMTLLLDEGVDVNVLSTSGRSALGHLLNLQDFNGETALWWASQCGHDGAVQRLLEFGAEVDLSDSDGNSPLCVACQKGFVDITKRLLKAGSNPNVVTNYGMTPLLLAENANHVEAVTLLTDKSGVTLGHIVQAVKGRIWASFVANITRYFGDRYGHQIVNSLGLEKYLENANERTSPLNKVKGKLYDLMETHAYGDEHARTVPPQQNDTHSTDECGDPIYGDQLVSATSRGAIPEMLRLIRAGANIDGPNRAAVPLVLAVRQNEGRAVQVLIESGAQVDRVDQYGDTALCLAAREGNKTIIDLLCRHHADIEHKGWMKSTPLTNAVKGGHADAVEILLDRSAKTEVENSNLAHSLEVAASQGFDPIIDLLLGKGVNVRMVGRTGHTPLLHAVIGGKRHTAETLLKNGAGCDLVPGSKFSPLAQAVFSGQAAMVELLAKYGADIDHLEDTGQTPLILAAQSGKDIVVQSLIDMGADLDGKDDKGRTALSYAKENGQLSTIKLLLQAQTLRRNDQYLKKAEEQRKDPKTSFEYRPLPEGFIRVLELQPGQKGNVVCFSLIQVELSKSPPFEALSYEWKGNVGTVPSHCDGERILVTPNCYAALEILRSKTKTRILWIDAICINQQDLSERGVQVSIMYEIYSKATSVLMWIGEERDHSDLAFTSVPVLSRAMEEIDRDPSYFTRAWVFQEMILAGSRGTVICGTHQVSWDAFKSALQVYRELQIDNWPSVDAIMVNDAQFRLQGCLSLEIALWAMSTFKVRDPRDKVFAALGVTITAFGLAYGSGSQDQVWQLFQVPKEDYNKSVEEVFIHANRHIISYVGNKGLWGILDPINQTIATGGMIILPSWAFDFSKPPMSKANPSCADSAEYDTLLRGHPVTTQTSLHVNGYVIDKVDCKVLIAKDKSTVDVVKTVVRYMAALGRGVYDTSPSIGRHSPQPGSHGIVGRDFSKTNLAFMLIILMKLHDSSAEESMIFATYVLWQLTTDNETSEIVKAPPDSLRDGTQAWEKPSQVSEFVDLDICRKMESRHRYGYDLVYTEKGYFGLAPHRGGDEGLVVTVVGGCRDLVLLRRKSSGGDTWYEYVSKVYMYGWTKDKIKTVADLGDDLEKIRFEIR